MSTWINPPPLGRNGPYCAKFQWDMGKLLKNLNLGESLALLKKLSCLYLALDC
jgi:hypothetical protein